MILVKLGIYLSFANCYGYLSDELYFLDASGHPAFGYVDFPPMIAWVVGAIHVVFSDALWVLRLAAATTPRWPGSAPTTTGRSRYSG